MLIRKGVLGVDARCSQYLQEDEDTTHILIRCPVTATIWEWVFKWCTIPQPQLHVIGDLTSFIKNWGRCVKRRNNLISVCYDAIWLIWKSRCDWMFKNMCTSPFKIIDDVKSLVHTWLKHKRSNCNYKWVEWCICPMSYL